MLNKLRETLMTTQNYMKQEGVSPEAIFAFWRMTEKIYSGQQNLTEALEEYFNKVSEEDTEKTTIALSKVCNSN